MFLFVICFNLCLTAINCYIAVQFWCLRSSLRQSTKTLIRLERCSQRWLTRARANLHLTQHQSFGSRSRYGQLRQQWRLLQRILLILAWVMRDFTLKSVIISRSSQ